MGSFTTTSLLLGFVVTMTLLAVPTNGFFGEWGPDLAGPWCAKRGPGQDCCDGRKDDCSVPILGTECYCDVFCNDTAYDCCPDFWSHCHGAPTPTPFFTTPLPPRPTTPFELNKDCVHNGRYYNPGDKVVENCNECTCELVTERNGQRRYTMRCTEDVCLIRPELIGKVNDGPYTWQASNYSFLWGMTLDDGLRYRLGTYPLESKVLKMSALKVDHGESLPESFDSRDEWPGQLHPIRDQGNCASSWAFSTTAVASDRLTIESRGAIIEELSAQHMLSCDTDGQDGCTGGKVDRAWFFLRKFGVVTEGCYPYDSGDSQEDGECLLPLRKFRENCPSGIQYKRELRYKASPPYRIRPLEREIMKEIKDNGPVQAIFEVKEDFYMYKSGVYQYSGPMFNDPPEARKSAYHSVRLLGWGAERTPFGEIVKYWIGANSWGPQWGEEGYFRIARGVNANNIESNVIGAWGKVTGDIAQRRILTAARREKARVQGRNRGLQADQGRKARRRRHKLHGKKQLRELDTKRPRKGSKNLTKEEKKMIRRERRRLLKERRKKDRAERRRRKKQMKGKKKKGKGKKKGQKDESSKPKSEKTRTKRAIVPESEDLIQVV